MVGVGGGLPGNTEMRQVDLELRLKCSAPSCSLSSLSVLTKFLEHVSETVRIEQSRKRFLQSFNWTLSIGATAQHVWLFLVEQLGKK